MEKTQETLTTQYSTKQKVLYMAFELSNTTWKLAFSDGTRQRFVWIDAKKLYQLQEQIKRARKQFELDEQVKILSCYEAGRDGFWLHRYLASCGIENLVVDSSSIEVNRRMRRAKTDRIDAKKLLVMLMRYCGGEKKLWSVVRVPTPQEEDGRQLGRELEVLKKERTMHLSRIKGLLNQQGIVAKNPARKNFLSELEIMRCWDAQPLSADFKERIEREYQRLKMVDEQILLLKRKRTVRIRKAASPCMQQVAQLQMLRGIGTESSWDFVMEFFGWRNFRNRKQVAALAGLTPTPYDSGTSVREQGISKSGNRRIRKLSIEIAWCWLRLQPQSKLSQWFLQRFAQGGKRMRRIGIVAVARRLLVDLWRYLKQGKVPEGAIVKATI
jgi:transposase